MSFSGGEQDQANSWRRVGLVSDSFSTGLNTIGSFVGGIGESRAYKSNASVLRSDANYARGMANNALAIGEKDAADHRRQVQGLKGQQRTGFAASGVLVDSGSALDVVVDTAKWGEYDTQAILYNSQVEYAGYMQQAANMDAQASLYERRAKSGGSFLSALGALSGGLGGMAGRYGKF